MYGAIWDRSSPTIRVTAMDWGGNEKARAKRGQV